MKTPITAFFVLSSMVGMAQQAVDQDAKTENIRLNPEAYEQQGGELNDALLLYRMPSKTPATVGDGFVIHHNLQVNDETSFDHLKTNNEADYEVAKQQWILENPALYESMQNAQEEPYRTPEQRMQITKQP
jgi:hypothetical protein